MSKHSQTAMLAFDKGSVRRMDEAGRMHVAITNISKANICGYLGREIPGAEALGLDPDKVYQLLRDPEELEKSVPTWNGIQLLIKHVPVFANDPQKDKVVGALGTDAAFESPYLKNSLSVWDAEAIKGIESETQKELSAGYSYRADMTPGTYEGEDYDGVMRDIRGNHVALVIEGRAGSDVMVGDSALNSTKEMQMSKKQYLSRLAAMAKGALTVSLTPILAQDAKLDLTPILVGATPSNWKTSKPKIVAALKALPAKTWKDPAAMDAAMQDVVAMLDTLDGEELGDKPDDNLGQDDPDKNLDGLADKKGTGMDSPAAALLAFLKTKGFSDEDLAKCEEMLKPAGDAEVPAPAATSAKKDDKEKDMKDMVSKPAMDAAIAAAVKSARTDTETATIKRMQAIEEARREVRPFIGEIALAMDSAEAIYKLALDAAKVDLTDVPPAAYRAMLKLLPKKGERSDVAPANAHAYDSAAVKGFADRFPDAAKQQPRQL